MGTSVAEHVFAITREMPADSSHQVTYFCHIINLSKSFIKWPAEYLYTRQGNWAGRQKWVERMQVIFHLNHLNRKQPPHKNSEKGAVKEKP